jgi:hypothetical protein
MKIYFTFRTVFIGYGLKTGQGFYPGPKFLTDNQLFITQLFINYRFIFFVFFLSQTCQLFKPVTFLFKKI